MPASERPPSVWTWAEVAAAVDPRLAAGPDWAPLAVALARADAAGYHIAARLPELAAAAPLPRRHPARELHWRLLADCQAAAGTSQQSTHARLSAGDVNEGREFVMSGETTTTIVGNITDDPEFHHTPAGDVARFTVASTGRVLDRATGQWRDGDTLFLRCSVWQAAAEHAAVSLYRGARVIVTGRLRQRTFQTSGGENRTVIELTADEVGASLRFTSAKIMQLGNVAPNGVHAATA